MFEFSRKESTINIKVDTSIGWHFNTTINCNSEPYAVLLRQNFADKMYNELQRIRQEAYMDGWNDKQKRKPKKSWWTGTWK